MNIINLKIIKFGKRRDKSQRLAVEIPKDIIEIRKLKEGDELVIDIDNGNIKKKKSTKKQEK